MSLDTKGRFETGLKCLSIFGSIQNNTTFPAYCKINSQTVNKHQFLKNKPANYIMRRKTHTKNPPYTHLQKFTHFQHKTQVHIKIVSNSNTPRPERTSLWWVKIEIGGYTRPTLLPTSGRPSLSGCQLSWCTFASFALGCQFLFTGKVWATCAGRIVRKAANGSWMTIYRVLQGARLGLAAQPPFSFRGRSCFHLTLSLSHAGGGAWFWLTLTLARAGFFTVWLFFGCFLFSPLLAGDLVGRQSLVTTVQSQEHFVLLSSLTTNKKYEKALQCCMLFEAFHQHKMT